MELYELAKQLFPICRSLTGNGVRETLQILGKEIPLAQVEVPSGTKVLDWTVPNEWNIRDAYVSDEAGMKVIDFKKNNLHVVGYSTPVDKVLDLEDLQAHLHSLENQPDVIPYVTSYYKDRWGFCLSHHDRKKLRPGTYRVFIDSDLKPGSLTYAEAVFPGESTTEILITTYVCHPSMANNEISGPVVATALAQWVSKNPRHYTYRFVFAPETIGAITYLSRHCERLKAKVACGFNLSCIGDDRGYSFVSSRYGNTYADRIATRVLSANYPGYVCHSFLERGSDERQYCSPGVDLPLVTLCRTKFGKFPEYHTSADNLDLVTPNGLRGGFEFAKRCIEEIEKNRVYKAVCLGEPQLGKRGLYPNLSLKHSAAEQADLMNVLAYSDGKNDLQDISALTHTPQNRLASQVEKLVAADLLEVL